MSVTKIKKTPMEKKRIFLVISMVWSLLQAIYNGFVGYFQSNDGSFSWWYGLAFWFAILFFAKMLLLIALDKLMKHKKHARFKVIAIVYLFISALQIFAITITPAFITNVFSSKIHAFSIVSIVVNLVTCGIFISSWMPVRRSKFTLDEFEYIKSRQYVGRSEGFFTVLLVTLNILFILRDYGHMTTITNSIISYTYLGIGCSCALYSFVLAIWLCKTKKFE